MDDFIVGGSLFLTLAIWLFMLFVAVLWLLLPFAVFGIKRRLDKIPVENVPTAYCGRWHARDQTVPRAARERTTYAAHRSVEDGRRDPALPAARKLSEILMH